MQTRAHVWKGEPGVALREHNLSIPDFSRAVRLFNAKILIFNCWELIF